MNAGILILGAVLLYFVLGQGSGSISGIFQIDMTATQILEKYHFDIDLNANLRDIPQKRIASIIFVESSGRSGITGDGGKSVGLMQIQQQALDTVNERYGYSFAMESLKDPGTNITVGTAYLDYLRNYLFHDLDTATQAYNVGLYSVQVNPKLGLGYLQKVLQAEQSISIT